MRRILTAAACAVALLLAACATPSPAPAPAPTPAVTTVPSKASASDPLSNLINKLAAVAIPDLQAALADAQSHSDAVAAQCYSGLIPIIQGLQTNPPIVLPPAPIGLVTAFQDARDLKAGLVGAPAALSQLRTAVNLACGALQVDVTAGMADPLGLFSGPAS
jgi:hypothetical protein